jgi:aerobic-type carbon monoxide dehydrogenase small subunit (CoxS/CutS family)
MRIAVTLNGAARTLEVRTDEMLLDVLRREGLASVRATCGIGACGACTAVLDGGTVSTCLLLAPLADGAAIETVDGEPHPTAAAVRHALAGNLCRCGCYPKIVQAVLRAADLRAEEAHA